MTRLFRLEYQGFLHGLVEVNPAGQVEVRLLEKVRGWKLRYRYVRGPEMLALVKDRLQNQDYTAIQLTVMPERQFQGTTQMLAEAMAPLEIVQGRYLVDSHESRLKTLQATRLLVTSKQRADEQAAEDAIRAMKDGGNNE